MNTRLLGHLILEALVDDARGYVLRGIATPTGATPTNVCHIFSSFINWDLDLRDNKGDRKGLFLFGARSW